MLLLHSSLLILQHQGAKYFMGVKKKLSLLFLNPRLPSFYYPVSYQAATFCSLDHQASKCSNCNFYSNSNEENKGFIDNCCI